MGYIETGQRILYAIFDPFVHGLKKIGITPNHITICGFVLNIVAALYLVGYGYWEDLDYGDRLIGFGWLLGLAGLMDILDGRLARLYHMKSDFGAFFDSVMDRYSEFVMFLGLVVYFMIFNNMAGVITMMIASTGSIMVSYTRARAESLGIDCSVGIMQRPERIVFVALWTILWGVMWKTNMDLVIIKSGVLEFDCFTFGFLIFAISTNITAIRRLLHAKGEFGKS